MNGFEQQTLENTTAMDAMDLDNNTEMVVLKSTVDGTEYSVPKTLLVHHSMYAADVLDMDRSATSVPLAFAGPAIAAFAEFIGLLGIVKDPKADVIKRPLCSDKFEENFVPRIENVDQIVALMDKDFETVKTYVAIANHIGCHAFLNVCTARIALKIRNATPADVRAYFGAELDHCVDETSEYHSQYKPQPAA